MDNKAQDKNLRKVSVLVVGGGPAGIACGIEIKSKQPDAEVVVIEKGQTLGNHNLSGAVLEAEPLHSLLDAACPGWQDSDHAKKVLHAKVDNDDVRFFLGKKMSFPMAWAMKIAKVFRLGFGQMLHDGDYSVSISRLMIWLGEIAQGMGVEVLCGFAAEDIIWDEAQGKAVGVKLVDQGLDKEGVKQPNYVAGERIEADHVVLAEGCDGLLTEKFIEKAGLERQSKQLYSIGVKELIKVSKEQYEAFGAGRVVHALGYPLWTPVIGPGMFGGGIVYAGVQEHLSVGMIVGLDWKYCDFNPQDALSLFKEHEYVKQFIEGGTVVEAGAHMIPEGGYYAVPREPGTGNIGRGNVVIVGDSAGFVNMLKIKGLHNALDSGISAGKAVLESMQSGCDAAGAYTKLVEESNVQKEMLSAKKFRQSVATFGPLIGMPMSVFGDLLPKFDVEPDYEMMRPTSYPLKRDRNFDKDTFTAVAATAHREEQPSHLHILNERVCKEKCEAKFGGPCITFCPAGVYETVHGQVRAANPSNCLHCKTCQRKCPFDNIRWTVPEGAGGPRYKRM